MQFIFVFVALLVLTVGWVGAMKSQDRRGDENRGVVLLDATTFPKIIPSDRHATVVMFSNKAQFEDDITALDREEYVEVALAGDKGEIRDLLFAQVIVNGGYNSMLAGRVGFPDGAKKAGIAIYEMGSSTPILYPYKKITGHLVRKFLSKHSSFYYPLPNSIPKMSKIVQQFINAANTEETDVAIVQAKAFASGVEPAAKEVCDYYVKTMEKVKEKGFEFAEKEYLRLVSVIESGQVTIQANLMKLEMKREVMAEFDRDFKMDPNREQYIPKALKKKMEDAEAKKGIETDIDMASLKDSINADL